MGNACEVGSCCRRPCLSLLHCWPAASLLLLVCRWLLLAAGLLAGSCALLLLLPHTSQQIIYGQERMLLTLGHNSFCTPSS